MRHFILFRTVSLFGYIGMAVLFSGCYMHTVLYNSTIEESMDKAKVIEKGNSAIKYNGKTGENTVIGTEEMLNNHDWDDAAARDRSSFGEDFNALYPDSVHLRSKEDDKPWVGIRNGLEYITKGAKLGPSTFHLNYLEIPIDAVYHYPAGPGEVYGGLGPYFAEGVGGGGVNGIYGENAGGFKRFDAGINFLAGYKLKMGLSLALKYDLGLANIEYANQDVTGHNRCFSVNLGFQIGKLFAK